MLEILLLVYLCKKVGELVEAKGYRSGWYKFFTVVAWFGGEFVAGFVAGIVLAIMARGRPPSFGWAYVAALVGAAAGVGIVFWIAHGLPTKDRSEAWPVGRGLPMGTPTPRETGNPYQPPS